MFNKSRDDGFALPTVVITSVVMFIVLVAVSSLVASTRTSLDTQYYEALATDASESGLSFASDCLAQAANTSQWGSNKLTPGTNCSGTTVSGQSAYVLAQPGGQLYNTTYTVDPISNTGSGKQIITVTGRVDLLRKSNSSVWKSYTKVKKAQVGGQISATQVAFGYAGGPSGAFFGTINANGVMRTVGYNGNGQLGNGSTNPTLTPTNYILPSGVTALRAYTSMLSGGFDMIVAASDGNTYIAGSNAHGQAGLLSGASGGQPADLTCATLSATQCPNVLIPQKMQLPAGVTTKVATITGGNTYIIGSDNNVYNAGVCFAGQLGTSYNPNSCMEWGSLVRANLPTANPSNPNTIPVDIVADRDTVYVRMAGGAVWGWGANDYGQLGNFNFGKYSNPVKIMNYGDAGAPRATKILTDGVTLFVLDDSGKLSSYGSNQFGQMGTRRSTFRINDSGVCLDNEYGDGVNLWTWPCNESNPQKFDLRADGTVYNADKNVCMQTPDGYNLNFGPCDGSAKQKFSWQPTLESYGHLVNTSTNKCVENDKNFGAPQATLDLNPCNGNSTQSLVAFNSTPGANIVPGQFNMAGITGTVTDFATDQWSLTILTSTGQVWSTGINTYGQLGNGTKGAYQPDPVKFNIPVAAKFVYNTYWRDTQNVLAVGTDGKVYGAGSNQYGQLGNGTIAASVATPTVMQVIDGQKIAATQVQMGVGTGVIFTTNGSVYTVGNNSNGQLGDGKTNNSTIPIKAQYTNDLKPTSF